MPSPTPTRQHSRSGFPPRWLRSGFNFAVDVIRRYGRHDCPLLAAAMAYYGLFSLFPFLLFALAALTAFLPLHELESQIVRFLTIYLPAPDSVDFVQRNLQHVVDARGQVGIIALLTTLWGSSAIFFVASRALNRIFESESDSSFVRNRVIAVVIVLILGFLLMASIVTSTYFRVITVSVGLSHLLPGADGGNFLWQFGASVLPLLFTISLFTIAYRFIPAAHTSWESVLVGAVSAGLGFELLKSAFRIYIERLSRYAVVYGSLATIIVLLVWIYIGAAVFLLGGELAAELERTTAREE